MFYKLFALLFFVSAVAAQQLQEDVYRIFNAQSGTTVRSNAIGAPLFVSTDPVQNLYELWVVRRVPGSPANFFTMKNIGLDAWAANPSITSDQFLTTSRDNPSSYFIESTDNINYVVRLKTLLSGYQISAREREQDRILAV
ncbi:hypothetical protein L208DRAFT_1382097 [Tricholoma matsutake]|nr:hypothetical protein L208DRAFT_1382097 [Tricholoma matsutake 945]